MNYLSAHLKSRNEKVYLSTTGENRPRADRPRKQHADDLPPNDVDLLGEYTGPVATKGNGVSEKVGSDGTEALDDTEQRKSDSPVGGEVIG